MSVGMLLDLSFVVENFALVIGVVLGVLALKTLCAGGAALVLREPPLRAMGNRPRAGSGRRVLVRA